MFKSSFFNLFKIAGLITIIGLSSTLLTVNHHPAGSNSTLETADNTISGFHITVKENNSNLVTEAKNWNKINSDYQEVLNNNKKNILKVEINDFSQLIESNDDSILDPNSISEQVISQFENQVKNQSDFNFISPSERNNFKWDIAGRSFGTINTNLTTKTFGSVYTTYFKNIPATIKKGLFSTINDRSDFQNYFPIPYQITASTDFLNKTISERVKTIPIGNPLNPTRWIVILASKDNTEQLQINNSTDSVITNGNISYSLLNFNPHDQDVTTFKLAVKNTTWHENIDIKSNSYSPMSFTIPTSKKNNDNFAKIDYLEQTNQANATKNLVVMNSGQGSIKLNLAANLTAQCWDVNPKTLEISKNPPQDIKNGYLFRASETLGVQTFFVKITAHDYESSGQYVTVYNKNSSLPAFNNCTNLIDANNLTFRGFQQYLNSTGTDFTINDLIATPGQFIMWFVNYTGDIFNKNYINYLQSDDITNPWAVSVKYNSKTLVNNWNIIIIAGLVTTIMIVIPIIILVVRKRKRLK